MNEEALRRYWSIYTDAWKLLKNYQIVTAEKVAHLIEIHSDMVIAASVFDLVWSEIQKLQASSEVTDISGYQNMFTDAWRVFKAYCEPNDTEDYWDNLSDTIIKAREKYEYTDFVIKLFYCVTLGEIERLSKMEV